MEKQHEVNAYPLVLTAISLGSRPWSLGRPINGISCSPTDDTVAVAGSEKSVVFAADGSIKFHIGEGGWCYDVHHSPDGKLIAAGYHAGRLVVYSAADGQELSQCEGHGGVPDGVRKVKFSPDGSLLASVSSDRSLRIWRVSDGEQLECYEFNADANTVDWFPDQTRLLVGTDDRLELVVRATPDKKRVVFKLGGVCEVQCVEIDGQLRIAANGDKAIHFFDENLQLLETFSQRDVCRIRFSADRKKLYAASWDSKDLGVSVWDMEERKRKKLKEGADVSTFGLDFNPRTGEVFMGGKNNAILRCSATGEFAASGLVGHRNEVPAIVFQPATGTLYSVDESCRVMAWDQDNQGRIAFDDPAVHLVESMALSADGEKLLVGAKQKIVRIDLAGDAHGIAETADRCYAIVQTDPANTYAAIEFNIVHLESGAASAKMSDSVVNVVLASKSGQLITSPFLENTITVFGLPGLKKLKQFRVRVADNGGIYHMTANHLQDKLYCACSDDVVRVFDMSSWKEIAKIRRKVSPNRLAISPEDKTLAIASDEMLDLYDLKSGEVVARQDLGDEITSLCFVDENCIAVGTKGGKVFKCNFN